MFSWRVCNCANASWPFVNTLALGHRLSILCLCTVRDTIRLIVAMSDRRSADADMTQTQQSGCQRREMDNASLVLKRKRRLGQWGERSIFILAWSTFSFRSVSEYRMLCPIPVPLELSSPNSNLLWLMWPRSCFQQSHLTMKRVYVSRCWGASIPDSCSLHP